MPHVRIQMYPGRTEQMKKELAQAITDDMVRILGANADSISIAIEEVDKERWDSEVYDKIIVENASDLYKKPGYGILSSI